MARVCNNELSSINFLHNLPLCGRMAFSRNSKCLACDYRKAIVVVMQMGTKNILNSQLLIFLVLTYSRYIFQQLSDLSCDNSCTGFSFFLRCFIISCVGNPILQQLLHAENICSKKVIIFVTNPFKTKTTI
jgi:hypothetical protein